jgi:acetyl esterase/lipase
MRTNAGQFFLRFADQGPSNVTVIRAGSTTRRLLFIILLLSAAYALQPVLAGVKVTEDSVDVQEAKSEELIDTQNVRVERDVTFLAAERLEKADLYFPKEIPKGQRVPAVVIIHGGGFNDGDKGKAREINIGANLAFHNYVGMSINYKLRKTKGQVTWPQNLYDCKTAVRWLRKNAEQLQIDPNRIAVIGCSAGGNLAAMLAVTQSEDRLDPTGPYGEHSARVSCAVDFYGPVDLLNYHDVKMLNKTRAENPELYRKASPITYVRKSAAPILIVHGMADQTVSVGQSETFAEALKKAGAKYELVVIPDAEHSFNFQSPQRDLRPVVFDFLDKHLKAGPD